jgi:RES domain
MESVLHEPTQRRVLESELQKRSMALLTTSTALRLVDLSDGAVLRALGISETDTKSYPYLRSQGISKAIYLAGWDIHGIRYASRLEPKLACLALFDCPDGFVSSHDLDGLLSPGNQGLVHSILGQYQIHLINDLP